MSMTAYTQARSAAETPRRQEYRLFAEVTSALSMARQERYSGAPLVQAIDANRRLWSALSLDCQQGGNALPENCRAQIVSLGLWVSRHGSAVARGAGDLEDLIAVNRAIMEGLAA